MTKEYFYFNTMPVETANMESRLTINSLNLVEPVQHDIDSLINDYNKKTEDVIEKHGILVNLRKLKDDYHHSLDNTIDKNMTKKRLIEMSINRTRRIEYLISRSKYLLIIVGVLLIFPILYKFNVLSKTISLIIWGVGVVGLILLALYFVYLENPKRNVHNFNNLDFVNPGSKKAESAGLNSSMFNSLNDISPNMFDKYVSDQRNNRCVN